MSNPDIKWIDFRRHASVVSHSGDHKIYEASNEPVKGCPAYIEKSAYDALQSHVKELETALKEIINAQDVDDVLEIARAALTEGDEK